MSEAEIHDMTAENIFDFGFCGTRSIEHEGCRRKAEWFKKRLAEGMKYKVLYSEEKGSIGLIEYIPGEYSWRAIEAGGYMAVHCLCIFTKSLRNKGYASQMIDECVKDAKEAKMHGVAVVTRKGAWMVGKEIFLKKGFEVVDTAPPDFELLVKRFQKNAPAPKFKSHLEEVLKKYPKGLTIFWSDQCPYIAKSMKEITEMINEKYGIEANIIKIKNHKQAQSAPSPYAIFSLIYDGKLLAFHPISSKRFMNIMDKELKNTGKTTRKKRRILWKNGGNQMKPDLTNKNVDIAEVTKFAMKNKKFLLELIEHLKSKKETIRYNSSKALNLISKENPHILYSHWDFFFSLLDGDNTYWKCSGIPIIANLTRVDSENKFEKLFEKYYSLLDDKKSFIPAAYLARGSGMIARAKPNLRAKITKKLLSIDETRHHPQRRDLVKSDIIEAFDEYFEEAEDKRRIVDFVKRQLKCDSPKTRKIAAKFLQRWEKY